jgi:cystathionine beta-lyase family protein involved in aluminum resistance
MQDLYYYLQEFYDIDTDLCKLARDAEEKAKAEFDRIEATAKINQARILSAFRQVGVAEYHLRDGNGYGYGDPGREGLEEVYALTFGTEAALVRAQIVSGTHAISLALASILKPGDLLLSVTGTPYDTLAKIIGGSNGKGRSLCGEGIIYKEVSLSEEGKLDYEKIRGILTEKPRAVLIQRSRGYSWRPALSIQEINALVSLIKEYDSNIIYFVDNCYGEFVEDQEPTDVGADLMAGSLIKNPGGGLAPSGGYLVGKEDLVAQAADRLIAPGIARNIFQSLANEQINVDMIIQGWVRDDINDIVFTVTRGDLERALPVVDKIVKEIGASGFVYNDRVAKVSIVGAGMITNPGVAADMFKALAKENINIEMISTSEIKVSCIIHEDQAIKAVQALHAEFIK